MLMWRWWRETSAQSNMHSEASRHRLRLVSGELLARWLALVIVLSACHISDQNEAAILIGIKPEAVAVLKNPQAPDPRDTGIASLDALNVKWNVKSMTRVFDVSPDDEAAVKAGLAGVYKLVAPPGANLANMVRDYQADAHIAYAEANAEFEAK